MEVRVLFWAPFPCSRISAITGTAAFGALLGSVGAYSGQPITQMAVLVSAHVFQRPGEIERVEWDEIGFNGAAWGIPAARLEQRQAHRVPLPQRAIGLIRRRTVRR
ncbi:MAG: hypothetical protein K2P68_00740 [Sphingomonas sp.]|nr:hypothetical protein [Sphingomonas sp.]